MSERIDAIYENGVFRPEVPVNIPNGKLVSLDVEARLNTADDLSDVVDLLDLDYMESCRNANSSVPSLEEVRNILGQFNGSLADRVTEERDER